MLSNCGYDENGKIYGGKAGDQTGREYAMIPWYNRPWSCMLRYPNRKVGDRIAEISRKAAENNRIGYDQWERTTYYQQLKASGWDPSKINKNCEADCSSSTMANVVAAGQVLNIPLLKGANPHLTTRQMREALRKIGFDVYTDKKYRTGDAYLLPGDILLYDGHHVSVNCTVGAKVAIGDMKYQQVSTGSQGMRVTASVLNVRSSPDGTIVGSLKQGSRIYITHRSGHGATTWFQCAEGWVSGRYLEGWVLESEKWWYCNEGYVYRTSAWQKIDGLWYYFDGSGWMVRGWLLYKEKHYYLTQSGAMASGAYVKSTGKELYYWLSAGKNADGTYKVEGDYEEEGIWEPKWDTANPDLQKWRVVK